LGLPSYFIEGVPRSLHRGWCLVDTGAGGISGRVSPGPQEAVKKGLWGLGTLNSVNPLIPLPPFDFHKVWWTTPDVAFHECTTSFNVAITLTKFLSAKYNIETRKCCPSNVGNPMTRARRYTVLHYKETVSFAGLEGFTTMHRGTVLTGADLYAAPDDAVKADGLHLWMCTCPISAFTRALEYAPTCVQCQCSPRFHPHSHPCTVLLHHCHTMYVVAASLHHCSTMLTPSSMYGLAASLNYHQPCLTNPTCFLNVYVFLA
jgi:hypothetical protein